METTEGRVEGDGGKKSKENLFFMQMPFYE